MAGRREADVAGLIEIAADDPLDLSALYAELRGVPGIDVTAVPGQVEPGEQGTALDIVTVALSSGAVTAFLEIVKMLLESRGPGFVLRLRKGKQRLEITADNADDALPVIHELFGGP